MKEPLFSFERKRQVVYPTAETETPLLIRGDYEAHPNGAKTVQKILPSVESNVRVRLEWLDKIPDAYAKNPQMVADLMRKMGIIDREEFRVLYLGTKNNVMGVETIAIGDLNAAIINPREVFKGAILHNAASIIGVHNHPSGVPSISKDDEIIAQRLVKAGDILNIKLLDSIVIAKDKYMSMKEEKVI